MHREGMTFRDDGSLLQFVPIRVMQAADPRRLGRPSGRAFVWRSQGPCHRSSGRRPDGAGRLVITSSFAASVGPDLDRWR